MPTTPAIPRIKPPALQPGDTVGIIAPASNIKRELLEAGCAGLRALGYKPFYLESIFEKDLYFAGSAERRARELEEMFAHSEVRAIVCARGGYGSNYLLETLNLETIKAHPKIFVGYSDITSLLTYISDSTGLVTFHGPMVTKDFAHIRRSRFAIPGSGTERIFGVVCDSRIRIRRETVARRLCRRNSLRWLFIDASCFTRNALRNPHCRSDIVYRRRGRKALPD